MTDRSKLLFYKFCYIKFPREARVNLLILILKHPTINIIVKQKRTTISNSGFGKRKKHHNYFYNLAEYVMNLKYSTTSLKFEKIFDDFADTID